MDRYERMVLRMHDAQYAVSNAEMFWSILMLIIMFVFITIITIAYKSGRLIDEKEKLWKFHYVLLGLFSVMIVGGEFLFWISRFNHWLNTL